MRIYWQFSDFVQKKKMVLLANLDFVTIHYSFNDCLMKIPQNRLSNEN